MSRVGIDFGGVISTIVAGAKPGSFGDLRIEVEGSFRNIKELVEIHGADNIFIVSRCDEGGEEPIKQWLEEHNFFEFTKFLPANMFFCLHRADKAAIARQLRLSHFIDDHPDVLWPMKETVPTRIFFEHYAHGRPISFDDKGLALTSTWDQVFSVIELME